MTLAANAGIQVAETQVLTLADTLHAVALRRFDRRGDPCPVAAAARSAVPAEMLSHQARRAGARSWFFEGRLRQATSVKESF
ncbi:MAG TPA: hypothetical protein VLK85_30770 [Ramlibacter sp.]|nr:hypothetical protein [Ramlibacter sp.]